jgi:heme-degrading monooxygenase HmoA
MYVAMNHFRIDPERAPEFEQAWRERESHLDRVPGFQSFHLLRGAQEEGAVPYASHTTWDDEAAFLDWTRSEAFRQAHGQARMAPGIVLGPPRFAGWTSVDL